MSQDRRSLPGNVAIRRRRLRREVVTIRRRRQTQFRPQPWMVPALFLAVMVAEGGGTVVLIGSLGILQTLLYAGLFYLAAGFAARGLARIGSPPMQVAAVGTAVFLLVVSAQLPIYDTPLSSQRARSNLWQLFD